MVMEMIMRYAKIGVIFVVAWIILWAYGRYGCYKVPGKDMEPNITQGSFPLVSIVKRTASDYQTEDIVFFEYESSVSSEKVFVGRVMGLPGDKIKIVAGEVFVNDVASRSDFVAAGNRSTENMPEIIVPKDCLFILCDNRRDYKHYDSRSIGPVHFDAIFGKK